MQETSDHRGALTWGRSSSLRGRRFAGTRSRLKLRAKDAVIDLLTIRVPGEPGPRTGRRTTTVKYGGAATCRRRRHLDGLCIFRRQRRADYNGASAPGNLYPRRWGLELAQESTLALPAGAPGLWTTRRQSLVLMRRMGAAAQASLKWERQAGLHPRPGTGKPLIGIDAKPVPRASAGNREDAGVSRGDSIVRSSARSAGGHRSSPTAASSRLRGQGSPLGAGLCGGRQLAPVPTTRASAVRVGVVGHTASPRRRSDEFARRQTVSPTGRCNDYTSARPHHRQR